MSAQKNVPMHLHDGILKWERQANFQAYINTTCQIIHIDDDDDDAHDDVCSYYDYY